jgi:hypothetical protein
MRMEDTEIEPEKYETETGENMIRRFVESEHLGEFDICSHLSDSMRI